MQIECILKREGGTKADIDGIEYHFAPQPDGAHVAEVEREGHARRFLDIHEAYRQYGAPRPVSAPVELHAATAEGQEHTALYGSNVHPATFEINDKTYSLGDVVALAHKGSGLDVAEWNELDPETRHGLIDDVLDALETDTNGDGTLDATEERAALVEQYKEKFGKSPGNMGVAKLREKLAAE